MKLKRTTTQLSKLHLKRITMIVGILLLIPLVGNYTLAEWNWNLFDFLFIGILFFSIGVAYEIATQQVNNFYYKAAVGIALTAVLLLVWINAAVGIIGNADVDNPSTLLYIGVLGIGLIGSMLTRLKPTGMANVLFTTAIAQACVPLLVLVFWKSLVFQPPGIAGVFILNTFFVTLFVVSGLLFQRASTKRP
jgi:nitrate/nitrite transporter NarK